MSTTITKTKKKSESSVEKTQENPSSATNPAKDPDLGESLVLPGREADESKVRELHAQWLDLRRKSLAAVIELGGILTELKAELKKAMPKRNWEPYVRDHLGIEPRTARNYMRLHRKASEHDNIGKLLNSETVSEIGIREMLDYLAELDKAAEEGSSSSKGRGGSGKTKPKATPGPALLLADGSKLDLERVHWSDGPISIRSVEAWMKRESPGSDDRAARQLVARRQRVVVPIVAGVNRACGKAESDAAAELVDSAFDVIRTLLKNSSKK